MTRGPATPADLPADGNAPSAPHHSTRRLFPPGTKEVRIDHDGTEYRLRITRSNKLILFR